MDDKSTLLDPSLEKQLKGHRKAVTALSYSPNELQLASSSLDNTILLWDLGGSLALRSYRFRGHDEAVTDVTFSPTGKYMASASRDKTVRLWVPTVTGSTGMFKAHSQTVRSVQFSSDGTKIITASDDKIVKIWSSAKYKFISSLVGHTNWVRCARMSNDGSVIASCSDDKTTKLWNPDSGELIHTYKDLKGHGLYLAWHPSGCYIAIGTSQGNIKLYDIRTHNLVQYYSIHNDAVTQVAFHPSGSYILTSSKDGKMKILDLLEGHPIFTLSGHDGPVNAVSFSHSGESFASAGDDKIVNLWKTNFTELASDLKENDVHNPSSVPRSASQSSKITSAAKVRNQGTRYWYLCYHSTKYPKANFVQVDDTEQVSECDASCDCPGSSLHDLNTTLESVVDPPNANSTMNSMNDTFCPSQRTAITNLESTFKNKSSQRTHRPNAINTLYQKSPPMCESHCTSHDVGHISHLPRSCPPKPSTYTIPSIMNCSQGTELLEHPSNEDLFGMIKLRPDDVCYTSGSIEWVGRKRSYPINTGFKTLNDIPGQGNQLQHKKVRLNNSLNKSFGADRLRECDCTDMLPTVNAIVDHLNALHEAVDIVDLRLNTLEDEMSNNN